jgi:glucose/arabinose dehydrogenase
VRRTVAIVAAATVLVVPLSASPQELRAEGFRVETVARLEFPVGMEFTPSGDRLFLNERAGRIRLVENGRLLPEPFATIQTATSGEQGLLGLALDPRFENGEPFVYVFHTAADGSENRVVRLRADGRTAGTRQTVLGGLPASGIHNGGAITFGRDGKLYVTNGDAADQDRPQNPRRLGGKVYRVNPDGSIPDDNPFEGEPTWSYGHRNPFGITVDPATGNVWESENGPSGHDEVNLIQRGRNYGWPEVTGRAEDERFVDPAFDYAQTIVPTNMAFARDAFPEGYRGNLFLGSCAPGYCGSGSIRRLVLNGDRRSVSRQEVFLASEPVVGMTWGPNGLYYSTPDAVKRVRATGATPSSSVASSPPAVASPAPAEGRSPWIWVGLGLGTGALLVLLGLFRTRRERTRV